MSLVEKLLEERVPHLPPETDCFRWVDTELSGVAVDVFLDVAIISLYRDLSRDAERDLARELVQARPSLRAVYVKRRPRQGGGGGGSREAQEEIAPTTPVQGRAVDSLECRENGARFEIRPPNGLSVGLYLDARDARSWVGDNARDRKVLNTFSYTCGFGVRAHQGGASRVLNIDVSRKVLDWGEHNYELNGLTPDRYDFVSGDVLDWLPRLAKKGETFDLIVLDPPGFATTKTSRFSAMNDYHRLVEAAERVASSGALVLAMCNVEAMSMTAFQAQLRRGLAARPFRELGRFGASRVDFRQPSTLKCIAVELTGSRAPSPRK